MYLNTFTFLFVSVGIGKSEHSCREGDKKFVQFLWCQEIVIIYCKTFDHVVLFVIFRVISSPNKECEGSVFILQIIWILKLFTTVENLLIVKQSKTTTVVNNFKMRSTDLNISICKILF